MRLLRLNVNWGLGPSYNSLRGDRLLKPHGLDLRKNIWILPESFRSSGRPPALIRTGQLRQEGLLDCRSRSPFLARSAGPIRMFSRLKAIEPESVKHL